MPTSFYITKEELEALRRKEVGRGKDGAVLKLNKSKLIKIYHKNISKKLKPVSNNDEDMKIYIPNQSKKFKSNFYSDYITYKANDDEENYIKIPAKDALYMAIERQKNISRTYLPEQVLYVDGRFAGCVLHRLYGIPIHKLTGILPKSQKKKILLEVLTSLNELFDNYIYHCDLSNSPYAKVSYINEYGVPEIMNGHSHVLINPLNLKTNIIDLDGKSTVYTERKDEQYLELAMANFATLIIEFLLSIETEVVELSEDMQDTLIYEMEKLNIKSQYIEMLVTGKMSPTQAEDIIKSI